MSNHTPPHNTGPNTTHTGTNDRVNSRHDHAHLQGPDSSGHHYARGLTHGNAPGAESHPQASQSSNHHHPQNGPHAPHAQHLGNPEGWQEDATLNATESIGKLMNSLTVHLNKIKGGSNSNKIDALIEKIDETSRHIAQNELARPQDHDATSDKTVTK